MNDEMVSLTQNSYAYKLLWHYRLGYHLIKVLKYITLGKENIDIIAFNKCSIYPLPKQTRWTFHTSISRAIEVFDLLYLDVWGPYRTATHNGCRFCLTIVDDIQELPGCIY